MRQTAQAEGKEEPDAAFEQRLKALRENAKARAQVIPCLSLVSAAARGAHITCHCMLFLRSMTWAEGNMVERQPAVYLRDAGWHTAGQHCAHAATLSCSGF